MFFLLAALQSILDLIESPENTVKIGEAKDNAGNDMVKIMVNVLPIVMGIQMDTIKNHGFPDGPEGTVP